MGLAFCRSMSYGGNLVIHMFCLELKDSPISRVNLTEVKLVKLSVVTPFYYSYN
jgi:hypothetical protein